MIKVEVVWMGNGTVHTDVYVAQHMSCTAFNLYGAEGAYIEFVHGRDEADRAVDLVHYLHVIKVTQFRQEP